MAQRVGRGIALLFRDRGTRRGSVVSSTPQPHFTPGKDPIPILQEVGWAPGSVWTDGKSRPHRDSIPDHPPLSSVAVQTELPGTQDFNIQGMNYYETTIPGRFGFEHLTEKKSWNEELLTLMTWLKH